MVISVRALAPRVHQSPGGLTESVNPSRAGTRHLGSRRFDRIGQWVVGVGAVIPPWLGTLFGSMSAALRSVSTSRARLFGRGLIRVARSASAAIAISPRPSTTGAAQGWTQGSAVSYWGPRRDSAVSYWGPRRTTLIKVCWTSSIPSVLSAQQRSS